MQWQRARFKGKDVWAAVDAAGALVVESGRTPIRYGEGEGARIYRAGARGVEVDPSAAPQELPGGVSADAPRKKKARGSGFGKAGTRTARQAGLAREAARALLDGLGPEVLRVFTDGGSRGNPGPTGAGAVVLLPDGRRGEASASLGRGTNNIGELTAIGLALDLLEEAEVPPETPIALLTDSSYVNGVLTRGWKAKANVGLIKDLRARLAAWPGLEIHWVAGHVGIEGNEAADRLANAGIEGRTEQRWI